MVPTITFSSLYCLFVISNDRRRPAFQYHKHPTSSWIVQQLREAFPFGSAPRFVIFDRYAKYGLEVPTAVRSVRVNPVRTSFGSPWQNGVAERWVGSCWRDLLDHIIAVDERHLKRRLSEYIRYYHEDRTHLGLGKGTPNGRTRTVAGGHVPSHPRLGGCTTGTIGLPNPNQRRVVKTSGFLHPYIYRYTARVPRERFLASEGEGMTWMRQPSRQGFQRARNFGEAQAVRKAHRYISVTVCLKKRRRKNCSL
jgi:hypothetical protein